MATGYLHPYQSMLQVRHQVIAVLTSDWTVLCFDHELKLLWKNKLKDEDTVTVRHVPSPTSVLCVDSLFLCVFAAKGPCWWYLSLSRKEMGVRSLWGGESLVNTDLPRRASRGGSLIQSPLGVSGTPQCGVAMIHD